MGCGSLWRYLTTQGFILDLKGDREGEYEQILKLIDGKLLAIDVAVWDMEVKSIAGLRTAVKTHLAALLKVVFERVLTMLRLGCIPVIVHEGVVDISKYKLMEKRYKKPYSAKGNGSRAGDLTRLIQAMGLATVQAPGEGEATCAAMETIGLVDGCVTKDADALAFGARTVFKSLTLSSKLIRQNKVELFELSNTRKLLGITSGGTQSLQLITLLHGGDYNIGGTHDVGVVQAVKTVQALLADKEDDMDVMEDFWDHLVNEEKQVTTELPPVKTCTGCRRCGCEGSTKHRRIAAHRKNGCVGCGTQSKALGGNGEGGCIPMKKNELCKCKYCTWKHGDEGKKDVMFKVFEKERRQSVQHCNFRNALEAYERQRTKALECAMNIPNKSYLQWQRRPDYEAIRELLELRLEWDETTIREKFLPLAVEWDVVHRYESNIEFRIVKVISLSTKGRRNGNQHTEMDVQLERVDSVNEKYEGMDNKWLQEKNRGRKWPVRKTLIEEHYPDLLGEFEQQKKRRGKKKTDHNKKITDFMEPNTDKAELTPAGSPTKVSTFETPRRVRKAPEEAETPKSPSSNKKQKSVQKDIRQYCSPRSEKRKRAVDDGAAAPTELGSVPRRLSQLSIYSDESDHGEAQEQGEDVDRMEVETEVVDLLTPDEKHRTSSHSIIDLMTPGKTAGSYP